MNTQKKTTLVMRQLLLLIALLAAALPATAKDGDTFLYDGIRYEILSEAQKTVAVTPNYFDRDKQIPYSGDIVIPETVVSSKTYTVAEIGTGAFENCPELTSVTIGNSVKTIGVYAFSGCHALVSIDIPDSVIEIGTCAFFLCLNLKSATIGNSVKTIGDGAFWFTALTSIDIPESVTKIGDIAFWNCDVLTSVKIGKNVEDLAGRNPFALCKSLTSIEVSRYNPNYCSDDNVVYNKDKSELLCYPAGKTGNFHIPSSVKKIGNYALAGLAETSIDIPNTVTSIGEGIFSGCTALQTITVGNSLESLTNKNMSWDEVTCPELTEINVNPENPYLCSENGVVYSKDKTILCCYPQGKKGGFYVPKTVTAIGEYAFLNCQSLTFTAIPNSVATVGYSAFKNCYGLASVDIGNSVKTLEYGAFLDCSALTDVSIPNSVTSIGDVAFAGCSKLTSLTIPSSVTTIGTNVFGSCHALTSLNIGMSQIPPKFGDCRALKTVTFGESVETIDAGAFINAPLESIYCQSHNPPALVTGKDKYGRVQEPFNEDTYLEAMLYVPSGRGFKYVAAEGWRKFRNVEEMDSGVEDVVGEEAVIRVVDGSIVIDGMAADAPVEVYDMTGKAAYRGSATEIPSMPHGIYIVRIGGKSVKVAV